ncbi:hypothetical protein CDD83_10103 [Cordyceps sp. RAO-2017]|nr:hypothetical protein CDD83_10103 [Cordyceps sp. RAO-2017]
MLRATKVPLAELSGERAIVTGLAADAKLFAGRGQAAEALLAAYGSIVAAEDAISGLNASAAGPRDRPGPLRPMVVQSRNGRNPNASHFRAAIPARNRDVVWWQPATRRSWMLWHELGHHRQHSDTWSWGAMSEVTVNIYSLAARRLVVPELPNEKVGHGNVKEWEAAKKYLAQPASSKDLDRAGFFTKLVMFEQLRVVFGDDFYHRLHQRSRAGPNQPARDRKHYFMTLAAAIAGENLGDYFGKWGAKPEPRTVAEMKKFPDPTEDYTTVPVYGGK